MLVFNHIAPNNIIDTSRHMCAIEIDIDILVPHNYMWLFLINNMYYLLSLSTLVSVDQLSYVKITISININTTCL